MLDLKKGLEIDISKAKRSIFTKESKLIGVLGMFKKGKSFVLSNLARKLIESCDRNIKTTGFNVILDSIYEN